MDPNNTVFSAIKDLVEDLNESFGNTKRVTPLGLYRRLITKIQPDTDTASVEKFISGFSSFFSNYEECVLSGELLKIPSSANINYGDGKRVYLEMGKYIRQADLETRTAISEHLVTISAILDPNENKITALEKVSHTNELGIDTSTAEGEFISGIMQKAKGSMGNTEATDITQVIVGLATSGVLQEMAGGLQEGVASGRMDMGRLMGTMQGALSGLMPGGLDLSSMVQPPQD